METSKNPYLTPSPFGSFKLKATTGKKIITEQKDLFNKIDSNFKEFGLNKKSESTKEKQVESYGFAKDATFKQIFEGFGVPLKKISFTMGQIIDLVKENKNSLAPNWRGNLFLIRSRKNFFSILLIFLNNFFIKKNRSGYYEYFVIDVRMRSSDPEAYVNPLETDHVWHLNCCHLVFVPLSF